MVSSQLMFVKYVCGKYSNQFLVASEAFRSPAASSKMKPITSAETSYSR